MSIPEEHSTFKAVTLFGIGEELSSRLSKLAMMAQVGDRFIFTDGMGTSTMEVKEAEDGYVLDVQTVPTPTEKTKVWVAMENLAGELTGIEGVFSTEEAANAFSDEHSSPTDSEGRHGGFSAIYVDGWEVDGERLPFKFTPTKEAE